VERRTGYGRQGSERVLTNGTQGSCPSQRVKSLQLAAYLLMVTRKATIDTIITKTSTILHLASKSSHRNIDPRFETETIDGGRNQRTSVISCFEYGQTPLNSNIRI
jgi:hypothetical protein